MIHPLALIALPSLYVPPSEPRSCMLLPFQRTACTIAFPLSSDEPATSPTAFMALP